MEKCSHDNKKDYMVLQSWKIDCLKMYKISRTEDQTLVMINKKKKENLLYSKLCHPNGSQS